MKPVNFRVKCSCGHSTKIRLTGTDMERYGEVLYYETQGLCPACEAKAKHLVTFSEIRMHYRECKGNYSDCKYKQGTYDDSDKTIVVYVPNE